MQGKLKEWLWRYGPAECLSILATWGAVVFTFAADGNRAATALAGTWAGNVAYFGTILLFDIRLAQRALRAQGQPYSRRTFGQNVRALAVEFGAAEVVDSFFIRPALMYYLPLWTGSLTGGSVAAKFLADFTFYVPAIISYELTKKRLRKFQS